MGNLRSLTLAGLPPDIGEVSINPLSFGYAEHLHTVFVHVKKGDTNLTEKVSTAIRCHVIVMCCHI